MRSQASSTLKGVHVSEGHEGGKTGDGGLKNVMRKAANGVGGILHLVKEAFNKLRGKEEDIFKQTAFGPKDPPRPYTHKVYDFDYDPDEDPDYNMESMALKRMLEQSDKPVRSDEQRGIFPKGGGTGEKKEVRFNPMMEVQPYDKNAPASDVGKSNNATNKS